jgi:hypothetical protein
MTDQAVSPLRRRMIEDMSIRKLAPKTQHDYVQRVKELAAFLGRSPDTAKSEDVRGFRLHLASCGAGTPKINATDSKVAVAQRLSLIRSPDAPNLREKSRLARDESYSWACQSMWKTMRDRFARSHLWPRVTAGVTVHQHARKEPENKCCGKRDDQNDAHRQGEAEDKYEHCRDDDRRNQDDGERDRHPSPADDFLPLTISFDDNFHQYSPAD